MLHIRIGLTIVVFIFAGLPALKFGPTTDTRLRTILARRR